MSPVPDCIIVPPPGSTITMGGVSSQSSAEEDDSGLGKEIKRRKLRGEEEPLKKLSVKVERLRLKEILVSTPCKGSREIFYKDLLRSAFTSSSLTAANPQIYEDWRVETVPSYPARKRKRRKAWKSLNSATQLVIPSDFSSIFMIEWAEGSLHSILDLLAGGPMNLDVMDGYFLRRLQKYRSRRSLPVLNFQYLSVRFAPVKSREQPPSTIKTDPEWAPNLEPDSLRESILLAPQYVCKHFYLAVFNFPQKSVSVYDSSWHYLPMPLREGQIQAILEALSPQDHSQWKITFRTSSSPQYDEYSCGSYAIFYADNLLKFGEGPKGDRANCKELSNERVTTIRKGIARELLLSTWQGQQFLDAISD